MIACSKSGSNPDTAKNYTGGEPCGYEVVGDYNSVVSNCGYGATVSNCESSIQSFIVKYPGINCTAEKISSSSINNETVTVTESYLRGLLAKAQGTISNHTAPETPVASYKNGVACSTDVLADHRLLIFKNCSPLSNLDSATVQDLKSCVAGIDSFLGKYQDINCFANDRRSFDRVMLSEGVLIEKREQLKILIKALELPPEKQKADSFRKNSSKVSRDTI